HLHPCREARRMTDRRVLRLTIAGRDRTDHYLTGVHSDSSFDWRAARDTPPPPVAAHVRPPPVCGGGRAPRGMLLAPWGSKQGKDAIPGRLRHITLVVVNCVHHQLERRIDECSRFLCSRSSISSIEPLMSANRAVTVLRSPSMVSTTGISVIRIGETSD